MQATFIQKQTNILRIETAKENFQNLDEYLQITANLLCETLDISCCIVLSGKREPRKYHVSQTNLKSDRLINLCEVLIENYQFVLFQGKPLAFSRSDRLFNLLSQEIIANYKISSLLIVPVMHQQSYLGAIALFSGEEHQWLESELKLVQTIAERCAIEMIQEKLDEQIKNQQARQNLLSQIFEKINNNPCAKTSLTDILVLLGETLEAEQIVIFELREEPNRIYQQWIRDRTESALTLLNIPEREEFQQAKIQEIDKIIDFYNKLSDKLQCRNYSSSTSSLWHAPIFIQGKFFGILTLKTKSFLLNFNSEKSSFLNLIAQQIAIAIQNIQTQEKLQQLEECAKNLESEKQLSEAANQAKSAFLSHMNHELRTPLTGILGFARMLKDEIYGSLNPKQKQYVGAIASSGEHLLSLVNDFLDISKIEANREELLLETMAVEDLCIASLSMVESRAKEQGLDLRVEIAPNVDLCQADRRRVIQILVNLLSNAIKFTEVGAVTLRVQRQAEKLEFCVIDTGIGIKKADQEKLFQPFQQINNPLTRKHKGTGLGLTLSRKLAQLHGGDLFLHSEEGKGSCFTLQLPL